MSLIGGPISTEIAEPFAFCDLARARMTPSYSRDPLYSFTSGQDLQDTLLSRAEQLLGTEELANAAMDVACGLDLLRKDLLRKDLLRKDPRLLCLSGLINLAGGEGPKVRDGLGSRIKSHQTVGADVADGGCTGPRPGGWRRSRHL
ncbi:hypothetical protein [Streptomyces sp. NPDC053079]|uniref:hypothetical protein n=1 Tax=Streptomyces sp. NPDC053079 TaxID=3365697 RepID=UPI0037CDFF31